MKKKTSKIEFKLEEELFFKYKSLCEKNGLDMSKRLRLFIDHEISYNENDKDIIKYLDQGLK
jgi:hypothetical protein